MGEIVYLGRDNTFELQLLEQGLPLSQSDMAVITRIDLIFNGATVSSQDNPEALDWTSRAAEAVVVFDLGGLSLSTGTDLSTVLIVYDASHPNGLVWATFTLKVAQV